ncbi:hypothetical protein E2C01_005510 [Portunus trituberculatus]|uniref:Uncharacterized protein n=1 Tax=Portunus trituberculatus TaxID=210409 RepID=A0A5B7CTP3_PORTR|nr:hypothetical protein [Portunus trituberculatus]
MKARVDERRREQLSGSTSPLQRRPHSQCVGSVEVCGGGSRGPVYQSPAISFQGGEAGLAVRCVSGPGQGGW